MKQHFILYGIGLLLMMANPVFAQNTPYIPEEKVKADSLFNLSLALWKKKRLYPLLIDAYQQKADQYNASQQTDSSIVFLKKALAYSLLDNNESLIKDLINQVATNYHANGQLDSAIYYFNQLLTLKRAIADTEGLLSDHMTLGNLYRERGAYEAAQQHLTAALKIAETEKDTFSIISIYSEIGDVHIAQSMWRTAETYFSQALEMAQLKGRKFSEAGCYKKIGDLFFHQNDKAAAIKNYEAALEIYEDLKNKTNTADVLIQLSKLYEEGREFMRAKELLLEALAIRKNSQDLLSTLSIKQALAAIEIRQGYLSKGIAYAEECLEAYVAMKDKKGQESIYALLADTYFLIGDYKKAYEFNQQYHNLKDTLTSLARTRAIKELDARYNTEKKDKEIAQINEHINAQQIEILRKNSQLLLLAGGLTLLFLLAALLLFIYLKNKQLNRQKIAILEKGKETQRLRAIIEGEEKERKRIAQELHDGLGAILATVKMHINGIKRKIPEATSLPTYQKAESLIDEACHTVREISHNLMPYVLEQQGLFFAMEDMCNNLSFYQETEYHFIPFGSEADLDDAVKITLFRITQELLKNIVKHARAKEVIVQLTIEDEEVILIVEDDGTGFEIAKAKNGIGLDNIQSRINYLNGELTIESYLGKGSTFTIQLPLQKY